MSMWRHVAQVLGGDPLALAAAAVIQARHDAAAGDAQARAWLRGELEEVEAEGERPAQNDHGDRFGEPPSLELDPGEVPPWAQAVLAAVRGGSSVSAAARALGYTHSAVYGWAQRSPGFGAALEQARRRHLPPWAPAVVAAVRAGAPLAHAAEGAGVERHRAYALRRRSADFAHQLAEAEAARIAA